MDMRSLYMIAIVPPEELRIRIEKVRFEFAAAYHCSEALRPPVHITLYPPYKDDKIHESAVIALLQQWAAQQKCFPVSLQNFGSFERNGVIFIDVEKSKELKALHKSLTTQMTKLLELHQLDRPKDFHPHFTIGYRDIPKDLFPGAVKDYRPRKFEASFEVNEIVLWKHSGKNWVTLERFAFHEPEQHKQPTLF
jgi:2'-5' RNA ligase